MNVSVSFITYLIDSGLTRLQEVLKAPEMGEARITIRKLQTIDNDYVNLFKELKENAHYRIVVDCHVSRVKQVLHAVCNRVNIGHTHCTVSALVRLYYFNIGYTNLLMMTEF